ncbi:COQ9 family protein [Rhizosaccharibacter radicis]|uniref:COQ9 family protein n=1 Tax=Rhizosaccharibacter radicis TaxID=2782605 RepID=A0ABT1VZM0_9PROT|nr:COQ9 family protein [Acetobacteraceae bacterium KSS12]
MSGTGAAGLLERLTALIGPSGEAFPSPLERSPRRDEAVRALLPLVPEAGWTVAALRRAAGDDADLLFPGGPTELVEYHSDLADRAMLADETARAEARLSRRVRSLLLNRLLRAADEKEAIRRGLGSLALPGRHPAMVRAVMRTADAAWIAAGDESTGFSRHSRRATLAGVYGATLLFWLRTDETAAVEAFLDRRLAGVARLGRLRGRLGARPARS